MAEALDLLDRGLDAPDASAGRRAVHHAHVLYRHVASRHELLVELVDHVLGGMRPPPGSDGDHDGAGNAGGDWRAQEEWSAREFRGCSSTIRRSSPS